MLIVWILAQSAGDVATWAGIITAVGVVITAVVRILTTTRDLTDDARKQAAAAIGTAVAERDYYGQELDDERKSSKDKDKIIREKDEEILALKAFIYKNGLTPPKGS